MTTYSIYLNKLLTIYLLHHVIFLNDDSLHYIAIIIYSEFFSFQENYQ